MPTLFKHRFFIRALAGVVLLFTILWIYQKFSPGEIHSDIEQIDTLAQTAGELTAQYLNEGSQVVLVCYPELNETLTEQAEAFKTGLLQDKVTLIATEEIPPSTTPGEETFTLKDVLRIQQMYPEATAVISLIGAPTGDLYKPDAILPLIVALNAEPVENAEQLFNLGIVQMALIPDLFSPPTSGSATTNSKKSPYLIVTAENARSLLYAW